MVQVRPIEAALGAEVLGVDLETLDEGPELRDILAAAYRHQVIVIRDQTLSPDRFVRFSRYFGRPQPHIADHLRHPEHPEILFLSNVFRNGEPTGIYDGAAYWHSDMAYEEEPGANTLVYSLQAPANGGETRFANLAAAYEALPKAMRERIDGLTVLHHYGNRSDLQESSRTSATPLTEAQKKKVKNVFHPLVMTHPVTGRKSLYAVSGCSFGIVGMPDGEAIDLLDELKDFATQARFVYGHRYEVGDLVVWDNLSTMHSATLVPPATSPETSRLLHRISVKGGPSIALH